MTLLRCAASVAALSAVTAVAAAAEPAAPGFSTLTFEPGKTAVSEAVLESDRATVAPEEAVWLAVHIRLADGWHTYWRNPGDSGAPSLLEWTLPPGFTAGPIAWPAPHRIPIGDLVNFGYDGEAWLLTRVQAPADLAPDTPVTFAVDAQWLVCAEICIPQEATLRVTLNADTGAADISPPPGLEAALATVPGTPPWPVAVVRDNDAIHLKLGTGATPPAAELRFFPFGFGVIDINAAQTLSKEAGGVSLSLVQSPATTQAPAMLEGVLVARGSDATHAYEIREPILSKGETP